MVKKISDIAPVRNDFQLPKLSEFEGQTLDIVDVYFGEGRYGEYAVITTKDGKEIRTHNVVVLGQLREAAHAIKNEGVRATVRKVKRYYILE